MKLNGNQFLQDLDNRRKDLGMSLGIVAEKSGLSYATVRRLLSEKRTSVRMRNLARIMSVLQVDFDGLKDVRTGSAT